MRNYIKYIACALAMTSLASCNDWLTAETPGSTRLEDAFNDVAVAQNTVNAVYVPLAWEYDGSTYMPEWFIGDVVSDDALKGGQYLMDMAAIRDMENFKTNTNNVVLLGFYRAQWQGISRANLALQEIPSTNLDNVKKEDLEKAKAQMSRMTGEAYFLRAYYYFRLARVFGGMPKVDFVVDDAAKWKQERQSLDDTYAFIIEDLEKAEELLPYKSEYEDTDLGRATKGAAQAMLMKAYLYRAGFKKQAGEETLAQDYYKKAAEWGKKIVVDVKGTANGYSLDSKYFTNFELNGENDDESVFEIQYVEEKNSDYGEGFGYTRGTFATIMQRSRSKKLGSGWGFNKPTQNLYDEYETETDGTVDPRRDLTILNPTDKQMSQPAQEIYLGDRYVSKKYAMYTYKSNGDIQKYYILTHATRGPLNNKQIRYSDVLLMYAEACCEIGDLTSAKNALNEVRNRVSLPSFPYTAKIQGEQVAFNDNQADLRKAIRHERRVELAMEGHRWFDLCRWGIAKETMDNYIKGETAEAKAEYGEFIKGKHELFPIPSKEIEITGIAQNPNW